MLAEHLIELEQVESISHETIRQTLKKTNLNQGLSECWVIPPEASAEFVCQMEDVLDVYKRPYHPQYPVVCFDESNKQLVAEIIEPLAMEPGEPQRYDYQYERNGVCNLFMFFEPLASWRHVEVTDRRTNKRLCPTDAILSRCTLS